MCTNRVSSRRTNRIQIAHRGNQRRRCVTAEMRLLRAYTLQNSSPHVTRTWYEPFNSYMKPPGLEHKQHSRLSRSSVAPSEDTSVRVVRLSSTQYPCQNRCQRVGGKTCPLLTIKSSNCFSEHTRLDYNVNCLATLIMPSGMIVYDGELLPRKIATKMTPRRCFGIDRPLQT